VTHFAGASSRSATKECESCSVRAHPPRTGGSLTGTYPWHLALDEADRLVGLGAIQH
jgi:hypothetical protein